MGHSIRRPDLAELAHRAVDQADVARELRVHLLLADRDALPFQVCGRPAVRVFQVVLRDAVRALRNAQGDVVGLGRRRGGDLLDPEGAAAAAGWSDKRSQKAY